MPWSELLQSFLDVFLNFLPSLITAIVIFLISLYFAAWLSKVVHKSLEFHHIRGEIVILFSRLARWSVMILGTIWALQVVGFNISAFVAGLGVTGLIIGFALQDISKNFSAGALLMIQEPFSMGDYISVAGAEGTVTDVQMRATELLSPDGLIVLIPNADVFTNMIVNYSRSHRRRVSLTIGVAYDTDLQKASEVAIQAIHEVPGLLDDPAPVVFFNHFGESSIDFSIRYWFDTAVGDIFLAQDVGVKAIKSAFEREGLVIPYPIRTILIPTERMPPTATI